MPAAIWLWAGIIGGYALMMWSNPARASFRDGLRAMRRYALLWLVPGALGCGQALSEVAMRVYLRAVLSESERPSFAWAREGWRDPHLWLTGTPESLWWLPRGELHGALRASVLPALENLAGLFHCVVGTFPISVVGAVLLFVNWQGYQGTLFQALRQRFGIAGWAVHGALLISALAALMKPLLYAGPQLLALEIWVRWGPVAAWLAFIFEYLFGVSLNLFLLLIAYAWVRGLTFAPGDLFDVALRRFSFVLKWCALILLLSFVLIDAPLMLKNLAPFAGYFPEQRFIDEHLLRARASLAMFVLFGASVQVTLTLQSDSARRAWRDHLGFLARCWWRFGWFLIIAALHLFAVAALIEAVGRAVGEGTVLWVMWRLLSPWFAGAVAGWLLASWVCVFTGADLAPTTTRSPVRF